MRLYAFVFFLCWCGLVVDDKSKVFDLTLNSCENLVPRVCGLVHYSLNCPRESRITSQKGRYASLKSLLSAATSNVLEKTNKKNCLAYGVTVGLPTTSFLAPKFLTGLLDILIAYRAVYSSLQTQWLTRKSRLHRILDR